ncbi:prolipoprotein diacylglyceryl transferase [Coraliomargarita sp. SDUM461003]|uniref:Phosphatidylglycerol--prolipoprotein diacylglyceryl transferase n=1 Tax=Thalassobacterium maritimum TaxID=3041265 RepID=A0ABU1AS21_9BACT|nr:prolipoprotein diacylglyceryl transferase [Coraliomargarita sp. SDUM461003]MDQ8206417.1 prolipoprotein diacylglyceryl transferase [Coraliomargarita sp. SDUM461003]
MIEQSQYWVHDLSPFLIRFPENPLGLDGIRYYGLAYLLGFLGAWLLLKLYDTKGKFTIDADARATLMTAIIMGVLLGGRVGYMLLYDLSAFLANPLLVVRVDQGGMASHGGFVGVLLALVWFARKHKCGLLPLGDVVVTLAPLGLMFGRIANFINGELWGRVSTVSWAVIFPDSPKNYNAVLQSYGPEPRHPSQLYEAALEGGLMLAYVQWRFWCTRPPAGQLAGEFLVGYGIVRILGELFREPDAALMLGLSRGQFYSVFMILAGALTIWIAHKRSSPLKG